MRLPSGDQVGLDAWSVARTRCPEPSALTTTISPVPPKVQSTATAISVPSGDHCGGDHLLHRAASDIGTDPARREAARTGAGRSHIGDVEAAVGAAALTAQEGDPPAVGGEPRERHRSCPSRGACRADADPSAGTTNRSGSPGHASCAAKTTVCPSARPRDVVVLRAEHVAPRAARPQGGPVRATRVDHLDRVLRLVEAAEGDARAIGRPHRRLVRAEVIGCIGQPAQVGAVGSHGEDFAHGLVHRRRTRTRSRLRRRAGAPGTA